jgi:hypothetical protein
VSESWVLNERASIAGAYAEERSERIMGAE